jgi:sugar lactone lactonase YvrE
MPEYRQVATIAGKGSEPHQFSQSLTGIALDRRGSLYAAGDSEIKAFDAAGKFQSRWRTRRPALAVAVSRDGFVYAGEEGQIELFDPATRTARVWRDEKMLGRVTAIAFANGFVLAGDAAARAIRRLDREGRCLNTIGTDNNVGGLLIPNGAVSFAVDAEGTIHAANPGKHRVERYSTDGKLLGHFGKFSFHDPAGFTGCCNPTNVAVAGRVYVSEKAGPRLKVYSRDGAFQGVIAADCFDPNCKNISLAAGPRGRVYAVDTVKLHILAFEPEAA